jgi:hypothetical protein
MVRLLLRSDAYFDWRIVPADVVANHFNYGSRIYNVNSPIVVNGAPVTALMVENIAFGASDQRSGSQIEMMFSNDYDLTGKTNIWITFDSAFSQESNEMGSLEYSADHGNTWLPIVYMLADGPSETAIVRDAQGVIDGFATFSTNHTDVALCLATGAGNSYGAFIGVASNQWATLGPYISGCAPGDHTTYHRVEKYRLPRADGQSDVRFRFGFVGSNSWDWGVILSAFTVFRTRRRSSLNMLPLPRVTSL